MSRRYYKAAGVLIGFAIAALPIVALGLWLTWKARGTEFDAAKWKNEKLIREGVRLKMADRIMARSALTGKTRSEVIAILGQPPEPWCFRDLDLVYCLAPERGWMSVDSEWLVLRFDANDRVSQYRMVRD